MNLGAVIWLQVPESELVKRLLKRAKEENRPDDTAEVIQNRLQVYEKQTLPVINWRT